jgi:hypothetical protein
LETLKAQVGHLEEALSDIKRRVQEMESGIAIRNFFLREQLFVPTACGQSNYERVKGFSEVSSNESKMPSQSGLIMSKDKRI